jgi:hypothetical protein
VSGTATATTFVTGSQVKDNTLTAADLSNSLARVRAVNVSIDPSDSGDEDCVADPGDAPCAGAGVQHFTVECPSGSAVGGGVRFLDDADQTNLDVSSYPATSGHAWSFAIDDEGPETVRVQLRVTCI